MSNMMGIINLDGANSMLKELCETIRDKHERVLVFTQFREITGVLAEFLSAVFYVCTVAL